MQDYKHAFPVISALAGGAVTTVFMAMLAPQAAGQLQEAGDGRLVRYKQVYDEFIEFSNRPEARFSSSTSMYDRAPSARKLCEFGVPVLPYIFERHERDLRAGRRLWPLGVVERILQRRFLDLTPEEWWAQGPEGAGRRFDAAYARWKEAKTGKRMPLWSLQYEYHDEGKAVGIRRVNVTPAGQAYLAVKDMGIEILPLIVEKLEQGDYDLLPLALELTDQTSWAPLDTRPQVPAKWFLDWWAEHKQDWLIPWPER